MRKNPKATITLELPEWDLKIQSLTMEIAAITMDRQAILRALTALSEAVADEYARTAEEKK